MRRRLGLHPWRHSVVVGVWAVLFVPVHARLLAQPALDIQAYGARCDGGDDSAAVNAALNALPDQGRLVVSCRAGIGASGIKLRQKTEVTVEGADGGGFLALATNPERILFTVDQCDRCALRNLFISGEDLPVAALDITNSNSTTLENNVITRIGYPALAAVLGAGNHGNVYTGNRISLTGFLASDGQVVDGVRGIWLGNPKDSLIEWNAVVTDNTVTDIGATAIAINGVGAVIKSNIVEGTNGAGVKVAPPKGKGGQTIIQSNSLRRNLFHGVQIEDADSSVVIQDNVLADNIISGVYVSGGAFYDAEITGNTITGNGEAGIYLYDANRVLIEENQIDGRKSGHNGIVFEVLNQSVIRNVRMHANTIIAAAGNGLVLRGRGGAMDGLTLSNNTFSSNLLYGLSIEEQLAGSVKGVALMSNCFSKNGAGTLLDLRTIGTLKAPSDVPDCPKPPVGRFRPIRINVGGPAYLGARRELWQADDDVVQGTPYKTTADISKTDTPELYQSGRWNSGALDYSIAVPNRVYTITLKLAEPYFTQPGQRIFDVFVNGELVVPELDILSRVAPNEALDVTFRVTVTSGALALHMVGRVDDPFLCAVEIE
jgi:parallel beta-helix repeat protein